MPFDSNTIIMNEMLQASVSAGAILAGASPEDVRSCGIYAEKIGLAFQSK
jgi:geranylgeranyl pyrophosphate synthase